MSTSLLSMNNQIAAAAAAAGGGVGPGGGAGAGGWCSGSVPTKTSTSTTQLIIKPSMSNAINFSSIPFRGNNSHSNNNNNRLSLGAGILMPISSNIANHHSTSANAMSMSLPQSTTIISIPQLSCSLSLPILCPKYGNNNHYYFKNNTTNMAIDIENNILTIHKNKEENLAGSLPNLKILDQHQPSWKATPQNSLDLYKNRNQLSQIQSDLNTLKNDEEYRCFNEKEINEKHQKPKVYRKNSQMRPVVPDFEQLEQQAKKCENNKEEEIDEKQKINNGNTFENEEKTGLVVPDKQENIDNVVETNKNESKENFMNENEDVMTTTSVLKSMTTIINLCSDNPIKSISDADLIENNQNDNIVEHHNQSETASDLEEAKDVFLEHVPTNTRRDAEKTPHLSQCGLFLKSGANNETAAAWLAAATQQLSRINNNCQKNNRSVYNAQIDFNADQTQINHHYNNKNNLNNNHDDINKTDQQKCQPKVRKTSILRKHNRSQSLDMTNAAIRQPEKKNVRFADTLGFQLENVRYFTLPPQQITRRYSSYYSPTYLNSEWNTMCWNGIFKDKTNINISNNNIDKNDKQTTNKTDLPPRYEMRMVNFSNPSMNFDFHIRLTNKNVMLHSLTIAEMTIYGTVAVKNIHFEKKVFVRYTFNNWANHIEREATYMLGSHDGQTDKFSFVIYAQPQDFGQNNSLSYNVSSTLNHHHHSSTTSTNTTIDHSSNSTMFFAIRYITGDNQEFWDNNDGHNYCLQLKPF